MRTTKIHFDYDRMSRMIDEVGPEEFDRAISHLATWNMKWPFVDIHMMADDELTAVYRDKEYIAGDSPGYVIGAVFNHDTQKFGFHS